MQLIKSTTYYKNTNHNNLLSTIKWLIHITLPATSQNYVSPVKYSGDLVDRRYKLKCIKTKSSAFFDIIGYLFASCIYIRKYFFQFLSQHEKEDDG
jgi:hypothetical protein